MQKKETVTAFLMRHGVERPNHAPFYVFDIEHFASNIALPHYHRAFYKITLAIQSKGILSYADRDILINDNVLVFANPMIPYSWERHSGIETGYFCLFSEDFLGNQMNGDSLNQSPLFRAKGNHVLRPAPETMRFLESLFVQMLKETETNYANKFDLLRSYVRIIMHEAMKIEPAAAQYKLAANGGRTCELFLELLERQFPIASRTQRLRLKNANEFAHQLSVHTNHLNRLLRKITGKTTSEHIAERLILEAKSLLTHTDWEIAEIGYCLGFEHAPNFTVFFKRHSGQTPGQLRQRQVSIS